MCVIIQNQWEQQHESLEHEKKCEQTDCKQRMKQMITFEIMWKLVYIFK